MNNRKILVMGYNTRHIVCSAHRSGYKVYSLDHFGDVDLLRCAEKALTFNSLEANLLEYIEKFEDIAGIVLGPGLENLDPGLFEDIRIFNNSHAVISRVSDKMWLANKLRSLGIPHPMTLPLDTSEYLKFPLILKPIRGSGGMQNRLIRDEGELLKLREDMDKKNFIIQEYVSGIPASTSVISTRDKARAIAVNEQLIGLPWLTQLPFAYCGNITPLQTVWSQEMKRIAEFLARELCLVGSNGVDFILTDDGPFVLEVNPRFQGSIDTIELASGMRIFDAHMRAFQGELPEVKKPRCYAGKAILFSRNPLTISKGASDAFLGCLEKEGVADVPPQGRLIQPDEPIITILGKGDSREETLESIMYTASLIREATQV
jgi:predicted ATP-grasp superfamily ATP-dependent carboligase